MKKFKREHHQLIGYALENFNHTFLTKNRIIFGGGTRIALELDEYRESIDIDFLCPDRESFRAVRLETNIFSLGEMVKQDFKYPREIRADRDAVRCFIEVEGIAIKLEFVSFANYNLSQYLDCNFLPVPVLSRESCFVTKLLANADRYADRPYKDIFDLLVMFSYWGEVPKNSWVETDNLYGNPIVIRNLQKACKQIEKDRDRYKKLATEELSMAPNFANHLLDTVYPKFQKYIGTLSF